METLFFIKLTFCPTLGFWPDILSDDLFFRTPPPPHTHTHTNRRSLTKGGIGEVIHDDGFVSLVDDFQRRMTADVASATCHQYASFTAHYL